MDMKGISWVGNIYQKFEAMCLEMEEAMYQDTARYVENQVQTVGASVKRFYSDVMLDLHPQFNIDPVKVAAADLSINPYAHTEIKKKLKANLKGHPRGISKELIDDTQVIKGKSKSGGVYRRQSVGIKEIVRDTHSPSKKSADLPLISRDAIKWSSHSKVRGGFEVASDHMTISPLASVKEPDSVEAGKEVSDHIISTKMPAAGISINAAASDTSLSVDCGGQNQADVSNTSSAGDLLSDSHADRCTDKELAGEIASQISSNTHDDNVAKEEINESCKEGSDRSCSATPKNYDFIESDVEIVERYDVSKSDEACVMVEMDRLHVPQSSVKRKSYKKKLRQVFSTKKKSMRKEYEQLGALHGDQQPNIEAEDDKVMEVHAANLNTKKLSSANDHSESEWEFL
ncbi:uncharacterized protein LOC132031171 isoform X1 [Lycium ferocissimum]|uniref:uncharacterized protein LOC132031171 isoform X1 n=1 Tax=Lycium ferocissimum TaxID=112874 RepID=UPI0028152F8A|nr:uncharacterized protein LOC132031171 isoform X1 [Lycium ferocissimum]XP_059277022.1 uncharacterized protein LOC132031171 isoform X1 [Lycium ferocissimum]XP_059277023.1 uncharacterized protein LOC132031171 isoform X1 [Lycium ferocissimum]XP_059277024.1 uncharacterized protein LOC132031171 isoform X1 [Lycium ferocissimum]XP_059277025.1 uncharacterized protein LOC132031171 isoform X1 [Lycium ferocissimum]